MLFYGHEIWIEYPRHVHSGERVDCLLRYGHHMKVDSFIDPGRGKVVVFGANGEETKIDLCFDMEYRDAFVASFVPKKNGVSTLLVEYDGGAWAKTDDGRFYYGTKDDIKDAVSSAYYYLYSKAIIPVGHGIESQPGPVGCELEIVPKEFWPFTVGDEVALKLLHEGRPSPVTLKVICSNKEGMIELTTDSKGEVVVKLDDAGCWMLFAQHITQGKGAEKQYGRKVVAAMLTLMV